MNKRKAIAEFPFCADAARYSGSVHVVEITKPDKSKVIAVSLCVGKRHVPIPRHRTREIIEAIEKAASESSVQYQHLIEEMNK